MAETNTVAMSNDAEQTASEVKAENQNAPEIPDIIVSDGGVAISSEQPEQPQAKLEQDANRPPWEEPTQDIADISGEAALREAREKAAEHNTTTKEQSAAKNGRVSKSPKAEKQSDKPEPDKLEKSKKAERAPRLPKGPKTEKQATRVDSVISGQSIVKEEAPTAPAIPEPSPTPKDATRPGEAEQIVYIAHTELHPFKGHPFQIRDDDAMKALVESVKERGVDQPALVRPCDSGGYELVAGHRRQYANKLAGYENIPCIVRIMTDDEAVLAMTESNFNQRAEILPSERAKALQMQLEAIKHQGSRSGNIKNGELGKRSNEIIAERNNMAVKQVQRYIALNKLIPELMELVDDKKIKFTTAVELSYIKPKNQRYIAVAIDAQESTPSGAQAQRMRELDQKDVLNGDVIDGIMIEEKKEEIRVILNSQELGKYFEAEKSPREMKEQILKLLDEWKGMQPLELGKLVKKQEQQK